jgi:hypothetical protein
LIADDVRARVALLTVGRRDEEDDDGVAARLTE